MARTWNEQRDAIARADARHALEAGLTLLRAAAIGLDGGQHDPNPVERAGARAFQVLGRLWEFEAPESDKDIARASPELRSLLIKLLVAGQGGCLAQFAASAVNHLAGSEHPSFCARMIEAIDPLVELIRDGDPSSVAFDATMALSRLMQVDTARVAASGAIAPLAALLQQPWDDLSPASMAAIALGNLVAGDPTGEVATANKDLMLSNGIVPTLVTLLQPSVPTASKTSTDEEDVDAPYLRAAEALERICTEHKAAQRVAAEAGAVPALLLLLRSAISATSPQGAPEPGASGAVKLPPVQSAATVEAVMGCLEALSGGAGWSDGGDGCDQVDVALALMVREGALPLLLEQLNGDDTRSRKSALGALVNLAILPEVVPALLAGGVLAKALPLAFSPACKLRVVALVNNIHANTVGSVELATLWLKSILDASEGCAADIFRAFEELLRDCDYTDGRADEGTSLHHAICWAMSWLSVMSRHDPTKYGPAIKEPQHTRNDALDAFMQTESRKRVRASEEGAVSEVEVYSGLGSKGGAVRK